MTGVQFPAGVRDFFLLASESRLALGPTQPPIQWVKSKAFHTTYLLLLYYDPINSDFGKAPLKYFMHEFRNIHS
jgi:hypothetical protein